jgi:ABC-type lipoprotein export system ATPase subunit
MSSTQVAWAVELIDVTKSYADGDRTRTVVKNVSIGFSSSDFVAIVGPSGSGKSTLLSLMAMLESPTSGVIRIGGNDVSGLSFDEKAELRRDRFGFVFQAYNLLGDLSVYQNVALPLLYHGYSRKEERNAVMEALDSVGMADRSDDVPARLSGGEQQRVAIARAMAFRPKLILADEPTGNLDPQSKEYVAELFRRLHSTGIGVCVVTHDTSLAQTAHSTWRLRGGAIDRESVSVDPQTSALFLDE